jgi:lysophospholipase L1-like esterase
MNQTIQTGLPFPSRSRINPMTTNRRNFLTGSIAAGAAAGLAAVTGSTTQAQTAKNPSATIPDGSVILFQGDSITDTRRSRDTEDTPNIQSTLGNGYAWLAASQLLVDRPESGLKIYNRGISGNKVPDLDARWKKDCIDLKPNLLSILIGVNDIWHRKNGKYDGTLEIYESGYRALLNRTKDALPETTLVICEPFVLKCGAIDDSWFPEFDHFRAVARKMAEEFNAIFVPFQSAFDRALAYAEPKHWAGDGVHPSSSGAALMAHEWRKAVDGAARS